MGLKPLGPSEGVPPGCLHEGKSLEEPYVDPSQLRTSVASGLWGEGCQQAEAVKTGIKSGGREGGGERKAKLVGAG